MSAVTLVPGSASDLAAVMAVMEDSFDKRYGEAWTGAQFAGLLPMPGVWLTLARAGDEAIGFALARHVADEAELLLLAVRSDRQGDGVGRALVDEFVAQASAAGAERVHLEVREGNQAVALYKKCGFELAGRRRNYYEGVDGACFDALTLARTIIR